MYHWKLVFNLNSYLICFISVTAILGDYLVIRNSNATAKAVFDNATHAIIGALCWTLFYINSNKVGISTKCIIFEIAICALIASVIDLDHFIAAKSLSIKVSAMKFIIIFNI